MGVASCVNGIWFWRAVGSVPALPDNVSGTLPVIIGSSVLLDATLAYHWDVLATLLCTAPDSAREMTMTVITRIDA
ncbi:hypothetical protein BU24DRAFT_416380 [Aaosphaeria arxii CBS 175.79]|uniref:Uncharacterized protein n=1 Tax=Aaosphaeria arxii CBS 175.79 TaxID=1450172 RepID=A0A6A5Y5W8_9PLEO|nr:uncharacterized protein BU24DRAFT_416380 [Aaosphaeria arxii CBS 175.79]KAF2020689.1 hypothetical protein BU24DRAFT_416380 [Aaosphaeria arxii CBS 175.79]